MRFRFVAAFALASCNATAAIALSGSAAPLPDRAEVENDKQPSLRLDLIKLSDVSLSVEGERSSLAAAIPTFKVLGLGEATHGTMEFAQFRSALIMELVREKRLHIVALETTYANALALNDYVLHGKGDVRSALRQLKAWPWITEEMLELLEAIRSYNASQSEGQRVQFVGFDIQQIDAALVFVEQKYGALRDFPAIQSDVEELKEFSSAWDSYKRWTPELLKKVRNVAEFLEAADPDDLDQQTILVRENLLAAREMWSQPNLNESISRRDELCAEMVQRLLKANDKKGMAIWAHNGHVMDHKGESAPGVPYESLGHLIRTKLGADYYALGLGFSAGSFKAFDKNGGGLRSFTAGPARGSSIDALMTSDSAVSFIDFRTQSNRLSISTVRPAYRQIQSTYGENESETAYATSADITSLFGGWASFPITTATNRLK